MTSPKNSRSLSRPLIVQSDLTLLLAVDEPLYEEARNALLGFAELVKAPEHVHTYRISPLSIWNARAAGIEATEILEAIESYSRYPVPDTIRQAVTDFAHRYGRIEIRRDMADNQTGHRPPARLVLETDDQRLADLLESDDTFDDLLRRTSGCGFSLAAKDRGRLKLALVRAGYPARDVAGYASGRPLEVSLRTRSQRDGAPFMLRDYQRQAVDAFYASGGPQGGSGVVVLPCGAGKTIVAIAVMAAVGSETLVLTTSTTALRQWRDEILDKTRIEPEQIGEYSGAEKTVRPVTLSTYQMLTHRRRRDDDFRHLELLDHERWGLIVYDEVHLLPAPVFQATAGIQARRRLGLTATLVREDNREEDVFALIGPKKVDVPWKVLERQGWVAEAKCIEIRVPLGEELAGEYSLAPRRRRFRIAAENPLKAGLVRQILDHHSGEPALIMGLYLDQVESLAAELGLPLLTGKTPVAERQRLYDDFRRGRLRGLVVSKVANFAVDLPDAALAVQVSGSFGSRQEEAQRLGRLLRPKAGANQAHFYTLVSRDTIEQEFALNRQRFLCEQGYAYEILEAATFREDRR